ncbi:MAG: CbiX/SirB N-terminal domain-containing protein [Prevotella sp.]|jgi:cobalamin biosynthesis Co2+ chelatase CbiK|nr:CbiX/SirB N-terminal domain-containing protein [Prevotella sp.]
MKKVLIALFFAIASLPINAKNALVIIAHGSPSEKWIQPVLNLEPLLKKKIAEEGLKNISYIRVAMMEFTEPTIATVIKDCETQNCDTVFAIPLFIIPSEHSEDDIPNIIGHKFNPATIKGLKAEGTKFVNSKVHIVLGPTLGCYGNVLEKITAENVKALSKNPKDEAILILAHGDKMYDGFWNTKLNSICKSCISSTGISQARYQLVGMGNKVAEQIIPVLKDLAKTKKRIIIQGVYLSYTAKDMASGGLDPKIQKALGKDVKVVYSNRCILPSATNDIVDWIVNQTKEWSQQ